MGLGLYKDGSGISAARFLIGQGAKLVVTDLKTREQLASQIKRLGRLASQAEFVLGRHREKDFKNTDLIVKNPGVPNTSKYLKIARKNKIPIETDISLFFQMVDKKRIIGITGTRGKSTTTSLIYEIIKFGYRNSVLGGNITQSPLAQMKEVKKDGPIVLELSSWMLESLAPHKISSHISVLTNIYPDHLNTYKGMKDYVAAKENIYKWQNPQDYIVLNRDNSYTKKIGPKVPSQRFWFSLKEFKGENGCFVKNQAIWFRRDGQEQKILTIKDIKILGQHNIANVLAAVCVGMIFNVSPDRIKKVVKNFKGIASRLEFLRELKGVKYYNDTTSTTPEATMAALAALSGRQVQSPKSKVQSLILIAGGSDKGLDFKTLIKQIKKHCKAVVLLKGNGTERLKKLLITNYSLPITLSDNMTDAVGVAKSLAKKRDTILMSPACASFGMFVNEFDRGDKFRKIISKLK